MINTGLSIATDPFLYWPDLSSQADEFNDINKGECIRSASAAVDAPALHQGRTE